MIWIRLRIGSNTVIETQSLIKNLLYTSRNLYKNFHLKTKQKNKNSIYISNCKISKFEKQMNNHQSQKDIDNKVLLM